MNKRINKIHKGGILSLATSYLIFGNNAFFIQWRFSLRSSNSEGLLFKFFLTNFAIIFLLLKLENNISDSRLTLQDSEFIDYVELDIRSFLENPSERRVLVFPPFNSFRRYLIHHVVETQFESLKSFSIGEGDQRRTVVCFGKDHRVTPGVCLADATKIGSNRTATESSGDSIHESPKKVKKPRTMPSISIYRPPAARKLEQNVNVTNVQGREVMGNSSPAKNKLKISEDPKEINQTVKKNENDGMSVFRNAITSIRTQNRVPKCKNAENSLRRNEVESKGSKPEEIKSPNQNKQRRPDIQVYVPKGRRSVGAINDVRKTVSPVREGKLCKASEADSLVEEKRNGIDSLDRKRASADTQAAEKQPLPCSEETKNIPKSPKSEVTPEGNENESSLPSDSNKTLACEEKSEETKNGVRSSHTNSENVSEDKSLQKVPVGHLNPEEDDWETMFDDTGECLDPTLLEQLTNALGEVTPEKPKSSYSGYKTKSLDTVADEFPHVIEIYNFPPEFQLKDLVMVFSQFKNSGFEIKWVDDTHALGIFSSSAIVSEVLNFYHPFVKTRSLKEGTLLSKMKARRSAQFLLPYKARPETCSALARRLVTGALGVRLPTSRQEREAEKQILTKAREKRRLEAKQKEDAWEGTFS